MREKEGEEKEGEKVEMKGEVKGTERTGEGRRKKEGEREDQEGEVRSRMERKEKHR